jgi:hypothetical protein
MNNSHMGLYGVAHKGFAPVETTGVGVRNLELPRFGGRLTA